MLSRGFFYGIIFLSLTMFTGITRHSKVPSDSNKTNVTENQSNKGLKDYWDVVNF